MMVDVRHPSTSEVGTEGHHLQLSMFQPGLHESHLRTETELALVWCGGRLLQSPTPCSLL